MLALFTNLALLTAMTTPTAAAAGDLKPGTYKGPAVVGAYDLETTGRLTIVIKSVDEEGSVKGTIRGSNGLVGVGEITGKIDEEGVFRFKGSIAQTYAGTARVWKLKGKAKVTGDQIKGVYNLETSYSGVIAEQDGKFVVKLVDD
jgi:hypothetical protein